MTLSNWINEKFGSRAVPKAAVYLGVPKRTLRSWLYLSRFPCPKTQEIIKLKSDGKVSIEKWRTDFLTAEQERKAAK